MVRGFLAAGVAACALVPSLASGATSEEVSAKLGARAYVRSISLSPEAEKTIRQGLDLTGG